jgi:hypothetical protein
MGTVTSTALHSANGSFGGGTLSIPIDASDAAAKSDLIEPRQYSAGEMGVSIDFGQPMDSGAVSSNPVLSGLSAVANGNSIDISFDAPANGTCYTFDITGTAASGGDTSGPGSDDTTFCVCYQEGDINFDSTVDIGDRQVVAATANLFQTMDAVGITGPQVDLNRDGIMDIGDRQVVAASSNLFNDFTAVVCP